MFLKVVFGHKRGDPQKHVHLFGGSGLSYLLLHDVTRCFRRVFRKFIK